ncbi:hypothetical protein [Virgibacillus sp. DJP39]|uniref:hypothetical protein n=1 Tax=Virgibacillus sp. DJP39 TaxID=3409790 RepID=UPI003BB5C18E
MEKIKKLFLNKKVQLGLIISFALIMGYTVGTVTAKVELDAGKFSYEQLQQKIGDEQDKLKEIKGEVEKVSDNLSDEESKFVERKSQIDAELAEKQGEIDKVLALVDDKESIADELTATKSKLDSQQSKLDKLNSTIKGKQAELDKLEKGIAKKEGEPINLISGEFIVGRDLPPGRYQATNVGEGSNFVVYSSDGSLKVNTILGESFGYGDYVFWAEDGDLIESAAKVKLIPVQE